MPVVDAYQIVLEVLKNVRQCNIISAFAYLLCK